MLLGLKQGLATESPLKMIKNAFYFNFYLNTLFVLKIFNIFSRLYGHAEKLEKQKSLIRKIRLISKFMASQPSSQIIAIHVLTIISGSKVNQAVKFGQLIDYNMRKFS